MFTSFVHSSGSYPVAVIRPFKHSIFIFLVYFHVWWKRPNFKYNNIVNSYHENIPGIFFLYLVNALNALALEYKVSSPVGLCTNAPVDTDICSPFFFVTLFSIKLQICSVLECENIAELKPQNGKWLMLWSCLRVVAITTIHYTGKLPVLASFSSAIISRNMKNEFGMRWDMNDRIRLHQTFFWRVNETRRWKVIDIVI